MSSKVLSKRYWNAFHENSRNTKSPEKMGAKKEHRLIMNKTEYGTKIFERSVMVKAFYHSNINSGVSF